MVKQLNDRIQMLFRHSYVGDVSLMQPADEGEPVLHVVPSRSFRAPAFGLFYFSDQDSADGKNCYQLCLEGSTKADSLGLDAVWVPERHFTGVGAASPNPSVLAAAIAMKTARVALRAGSVVLPLHHPVRVAEEWAMVDRLSGGRAGVSFASGWVPDDFVFAPDQYAVRRQIMSERLKQVQALWAGEAVEFKNGVGHMTPVRIRPAPLLGSIPVWLTAVGSTDTFAMAGRLGVNVLTALLELSIGQLEENIKVYRAEREAAGFNPESGNVTVMMHTYLLPDQDEAIQKARPAMRSYFIVQSALRHAAAKTVGMRVGDNSRISDRMLDYSVDKFVNERCLIGSPATAQTVVQRLVDAGANEFACLIDFGLSVESVMLGIDSIAELRMSPYRALEHSLNQLIASEPGPPCTVRVLAHELHGSGEGSTRRPRL